MPIDAIARSIFALVVAYLLASASARAEVRDGQVGAACASAAECDAGLTCWAPGAPESSAGGPAGGVCSSTCGYPYLCATESRCADELGVGYCLEPCTLNASFGDELDPEKCHGRPDMACVFSYYGPLCMPRCSADEQCPTGFACDPRTGRCSAEAPAGDRFGSPCDPTAATPTCRGTCRLYGGEDVPSAGEGGQGAEPPPGVCDEACVIGATDGCGLPEGSGEGACLLPASGFSNGDQGLCVRLCDCSSDCPDIMVCEPWDFEGRYDFAGACVLGTRAPGARDCPIPASGGAGAEPECVLGERRACMTADGCLGIATCLPDETYAECECPDRGNGEGGAAVEPGLGRPRGAAGADAFGGTAGSPELGGAGGDPGVPHGRPPDYPEHGWACDCRMTRTPHRSDSLVWIGCVVLVGLGRARVRRGRLRA